MEPTRRAAHELLALLEATYQPTHRYVTANPAQYRHLDIAWYDRTAQGLGREGFRTICDVEDKTITESPGTVLSAVKVRMLLSRDGTIIAGLYHPHLRSFALRVLLWLLRKLPPKTTDFETEFTDGSFVATSNAASAAAIGNGPMIRSEFLPARTPPVAVLQRHEARVAEHLRAHPGVAARVACDFDDIRSAQHRMHALKAAYRGEVGMITREELERLATPGGAAIVPQVHEELARERAQKAREHPVAVGRGRVTRVRSPPPAPSIA